MRLSWQERIRNIPKPPTKFELAFREIDEVQTKIWTVYTVRIRFVSEPGIVHEVKNKLEGEKAACEEALAKVVPRAGATSRPPARWRR